MREITQIKGLKKADQRYYFDYWNAEW